MWKKLKLIMLPTDRKANIGDYILAKYDEKSIIDGVDKNNTLVYGKKVMEGTVKQSLQHLYIISDEEIKRGDWFTDLLKVRKCKYSSENELGIVDSLSLCVQKVGQYKIIASTDSSLVTKEVIFENAIIKKEWTNKHLPTFSKEFISLYIEEYNKGNIIEEVEVEYEDKGYQKLMNPEDKPTKQHHYWQENIILKLNSNNEISIKLIKQNWSREEVIALINKSHYDRTGNPSIIMSNLKISDKWIKENL